LLTSNVDGTRKGACVLPTPAKVILGVVALSHEKNTKVMQQEIDHLKRELLHEWRSQSLTVSYSSSNNGEDDSYKRRSRTSPSESFSHDEEYHHGHGNKNSSSKGIGNDALSKVLKQISKSPFTRRIEEGKLPQQFTQPTFTAYNGRTDPVKHVNHFNQRMAVHSRNEALMCKVFPSSFEPVVMRWFDGLRVESIDFFEELTQPFGSHFITCSRVAQPLASLLSLSMREVETLEKNSDRYWEMFNEIKGDFDDIAISTFKLGLPAERGLRKSLTGKPITSIR